MQPRGGRCKRDASARCARGRRPRPGCWPPWLLRISRTPCNQRRSAPSVYGGVPPERITRPAGSEEPPPSIRPPRPQPNAGGLVAPPSQGGVRRRGRGRRRPRGGCGVRAAAWAKETWDRSRVGRTVLESALAAYRPIGGARLASTAAGRSLGDGEGSALADASPRGLALENTPRGLRPSREDRNSQGGQPPPGETGAPAPPPPSGPGTTQVPGGHDPRRCCLARGMVP